MAQTLVIDLGETFATVTITTQQDLDINSEKLGHLRDALKDCLPRRAPKRPRRQRVAPEPAEKPAVRDDSEGRIIRKWANANGYDVPAHGRLPKEIRAAWRERNQVTPLHSSVNGASSLG